MSATSCTRMQLLVQAELDGELGVAEAAELAMHLDTCPACRAAQARIRQLSLDLRAQMPHYAAPAALRRSLAASLPDAPRRARLRPRAALGVGAAMALAASVTLLLAPRGDDRAGQAVASHIRALQPGHLTDVMSSDQHTVKPWFDGRLDYAPPVRDFAAAGFLLVGGRLDYLGGRAVAALVYRRDRHLIDLYVWPGDGGGLSRRVEGYDVLGWRAGEMRFLAVSDLNAAELAAFAALWHAPAP